MLLPLWGVAAWLLLDIRCVSGWALPWLVTSYYEVYTSTIVTPTTFTFISETDAGFIETNIVEVVPTQTPIPTVSAVTTINKFYSDVTMVDVLLPHGAGTSVADNFEINPTTYYVELTFTGPTSCTPEWTYTTPALLDIPPMITLAPTHVSTILTQFQVFGATSTEYSALVNPTDLPAAVLSSLRSQYEPYFSDECSIPYYYTATGTPTGSGSSPTPGSGSSSGNGGGNSGNNGVIGNPSNGWAGCDPVWEYVDGIEIGEGYMCADGLHLTRGISITDFVLIWIFGWFGLFFLIGLIESYIRFSKLCRGLPARRGMPLAFACLMPLLSCLCLCLSNKGYVARSPADQVLLRSQWQSFPFYKKFGYWIHYGFRSVYPPFLGQEPVRRSNWGNKPPTTVWTRPDAPGATGVPVTTFRANQELERGLGVGGVVGVGGVGQTHFGEVSPIQEMEQPPQVYYEMPSPQESGKKGFELPAKENEKKGFELPAGEK